MWIQKSPPNFKPKLRQMIYSNRKNCFKCWPKIIPKKYQLNPGAYKKYLIPLATLTPFQMEFRVVRVMRPQPPSGGVRNQHVGANWTLKLILHMEATVPGY